MQPVIQYISLFMKYFSWLILSNSINAKTLAVCEGINPAQTQSRNKLVLNLNKAIKNDMKHLFLLCKAMPGPGHKRIASVLSVLLQQTLFLRGDPQSRSDTCLSSSSVV